MSTLSPGRDVAIDLALATIDDHILELRITAASTAVRHLQSVTPSLHRVDLLLRGHAPSTLLRTVDGGHVEPLPAPMPVGLHSSGLAIANWLLDVLGAGATSHCWLELHGDSADAWTNDAVGLRRLGVLALDPADPPTIPPAAPAAMNMTPTS